MTGSDNPVILYMYTHSEKEQITVRAADETPLLGEMSAARTEGWAVSGEERPYNIYCNTLAIF